MKTLQDQFEKEFRINTLNSASIVRYLQTGKVSGSLSVFLAKANQRLIEQAQEIQRKDEEINAYEKSVDYVTQCFNSKEK